MRKKCLKHTAKSMIKEIFQNFKIMASRLILHVIDLENNLMRTFRNKMQKFLGFIDNFPGSKWFYVFVSIIKIYNYKNQFSLI